MSNYCNFCLTPVSNVLFICRSCLDVAHANPEMLDWPSYTVHGENLPLRQVQAKDQLSAVSKVMLAFPNATSIRIRKIEP